MKVLIADSGSTKTRWTLAADEGKVVTTAGLNPLLTPEEDFHEAVRQMLTGLPAANNVQEVWFYGAGCGTREMQSRVTQWLGEHLPEATIHATGDLLGACRATCGQEAGLVGILGTGSNLCHYNGDDIDRRWMSTGYLLGDEGSGNHIGRRLLKDYLEETMPDGISTLFHIEHPMSHEEFLHNLYSEPYPNRFLASFVPFAAHHIDDPYVDSVVRECFDTFMSQVARHHLSTRDPLHLVGGLTTVFAHELEHAAQRAGLTLASLTADPLEGMRRFHMGLPSLCGS